MSFQGKKSIPRITVRRAPGPRGRPPAPRRAPCPPAFRARPRRFLLSGRRPFPRCREPGVPASAAPSTARSGTCRPGALRLPGPLSASSERGRPGGPESADAPSSPGRQAARRRSRPWTPPQGRRADALFVGPSARPPGRPDPRAEPLVPRQSDSARPLRPEPSVARTRYTDPGFGELTGSRAGTPAAPTLGMGDKTTPHPPTGTRTAAGGQTVLLHSQETKPPLQAP